MDKGTKRSAVLWFASALVYAVFCWWYTNTGGPLSDDEIEGFLDAMRANDSAPERIANLRRFMEEDDGGQFLMVNVIDLAATPKAGPGVPAGESASALMAHYMDHMIPELLSRACHPALAGDAIFEAMDMAGVEDLPTAERWTSFGLVRYRSRRDLLEIGLAPAFSGEHEFKVAALEKTIAYPVEPTLYFSDPRLLLLFALVAVAALADRFLLRRSG